MSGSACVLVQELALSLSLHVAVDRTVKMVGFTALRPLTHTGTIDVHIVGCE